MRWVGSAARRLRYSMRTLARQFVVARSLFPPPFSVVLFLWIGVVMCGAERDASARVAERAGTSTLKLLKRVARMVMSPLAVDASAAGIEDTCAAAVCSIANADGRQDDCVTVIQVNHAARQGEARPIISPPSPSLRARTRFPRTRHAYQSRYVCCPIRGRTPVFLRTPPSRRRTPSSTCTALMRWRWSTQD